MTGRAVLMAAAMLAVAATPVTAADDVPARLDAARAAYAKGDLARAAHEVEAALQQMHDRLGKALADTLPQLPGAWKGDEAEIQGLGQIGGGLSVTRAYTKGDASLNASLLLDSPASESAAALLTDAVNQPHLKVIKVGADDAVLRFDASAHSGEVTMVIANRVVLEIEGDDITSADPLIEAARAWNVARIRTLLSQPMP